MQLEIYQYIVPFLSGLLIIRILLQFKARRRTVMSTAIWSAFWVLVSILAFAPHLISMFMAEVLGFKDNVHAVLFMGLGVALVIIFYLSSMVDKLERQLTDLVRTLALKNSSKTKEENQPKEIRQVESKPASSERESAIKNP